MGKGLQLLRCWDQGSHSALALHRLPELIGRHFSSTNTCRRKSRDASDTESGRMGFVGCVAILKIAAMASYSAHGVPREEMAGPDPVTPVTQLRTHAEQTKNWTPPELSEGQPTLSGPLKSYRYTTDVTVHKASSWPRRSRVPLAAPSHFLSDRKQGAVFLYKFGFTAGKPRGRRNDQMRERLQH
ncbi:hypothetical protein F7725_029133, partial [Dissostichus mawsoni]